MQIKNKTKQLLQVSDTAAHMICMIGLLFVFLSLSGMCVSVFVYPFEPPIKFLTGLFAGSILSTAKVILLHRTLIKAMGLSEQKAQAYAALQAAVRYILTGIVLILVVMLPQVFGLIGIILGLLTLQFSAYLTGFSRK